MRTFLIFLFLSFSLRSFAQENLSSDTVTVKELKELVITATRQEESIFQSPVSIEKLNLQQIKSSAQPGFFEAIQNLKGIQVITPSLGFRVINARGFAHTTNVRFVQLVDGIDNQAPHIGAPIGNSLGPSDLDILAVEVIPGSSSSMYGMNAINGIANFITKNPFDFQGVSVQQKTGANNINAQDFRNSIFTETNFRIAEVFGSKFALKINGTFLKGTDWYADNQTDLFPGANLSTSLVGESNPGKDLVNVYGDESSNRRTLTLGGKQYVVSRTGYAEKDVADYDLQNLKADVSLYFRPKALQEFSYTFRTANQDNIYQRTNRFQFDNYQTHQHALSFQSPSIRFKGYYTLENTGDSYNIRSMAENIDRSFKSDNTWFGDFSRQFNALTNSGTPVNEAMQLSRAFADSGRILPNTPEMEAKIDELRSINNWDIGAALRVKASMVHSEFQHDLSSVLFKKSDSFSLMYGLDYRQYLIVPDGNYFINPTEPEETLGYWKTGGFVQGSKTLLSDRLKISGVLRLEKNQYYPVKANPRIALVYSPGPYQTIRFSAQNGYRFPSIFEAFSNINSGGRKRIGGLPVMSDGIFENSYTQASITQFQRAVQSDINTNGSSLEEAVNQHQNLLTKNPYTYLEPEEVTSLEAGYRAVFMQGKLSLDFDVYFNQYRNLIAQIDANVPKTTNSDSIPYFFLDRSAQDYYRLWTNSKTISKNWGSTLGLSYELSPKIKVGGNFTYANLSNPSRSDGLEDGFNTPEWVYNLFISSPAIYKTLGFSVNFRQQDEFLWQSALATGIVDQYSTLDIQANASFWKGLLNLKIGASNALNDYYYSFIGGPAIGGFYYSTLTLNLGQLGSAR